VSIIEHCVSGTTWVKCEYPRILDCPVHPDHHRIVEDNEDEPTYTPRTLRLVSEDMKKAGAAEERARCLRWVSALRMGELDDVRRVIFGIKGGTNFEDE
jgi:hypothetical protein